MSASDSKSQTRTLKTIHLKTIVAPTDFSEESYKAVDYAASLAKGFGGRLVLLHVLIPITSPDFVYGPVTWDEAQARDLTRKKLMGLVESFPELSGIPVETVVSVGDPSQELVNVARQKKADLVILSTHGHTGLKHFFLGSVAEKVVRHSPCPVMVVRESENEFIE